MNDFGIQYPNKSSNITSKKYNTVEISNLEDLELKKVLQQFQVGYTTRDLNDVEDFVEELFIMKDDTCVLGTGTGELFIGIDQIKTLIRNDWQYWGDVNIDLENVHIDKQNEVAWFATTGTIKYAFQDTAERYDNYLNFIKNKVKETDLTPKQKITFINWVLSLTYHQRSAKQREYLWSLRLSGVLLKDNGKWKFTHMQFSIPKAIFPDERFESSKEYIESYNSQNAIIDKYWNVPLYTEIKFLLQSLQMNLFGKKDISKELMMESFTTDSVPYIIEPDNNLSIGVDQIKEFFTSSIGSTISLDLNHAITSEQNGITWVIVCGLLKTSLTEDELYTRTLDELEGLFEEDTSSKDKLFAIHRNVSYALKESATGKSYTCPIRLTAVIVNQAGRSVFQNIHFSFPFYWVLEGKLDSI